MMMSLDGSVARVFDGAAGKGVPVRVARRDAVQQNLPLSSPPVASSGRLGQQVRLFGGGGAQPLLAHSLLRLKLSRFF